MGKEGCVKEPHREDRGQCCPDPDTASASVSLSLSEGDNQVGKSSNLTAPHHVLTKGPVVEHSPKNADCPAWESSWQMSPPGVPGTH